jgi:hypothetical protein
VVQFLLSQVLGLVQFLLDSLLHGFQLLLVLGILGFSQFLNLEIMFLQSVLKIVKPDISDFNSMAEISLELRLKFLKFLLIVGHLSLYDFLLFILELDTSVLLKLLLSLFFSSLKFVLNLFKSDVVSDVRFLQSLLYLDVIVGDVLVVLFVGDVNKIGYTSVLTVSFFFEQHVGLHFLNMWKT